VEKMQRIIQVTEAFRRHVDPSALTVVRAGDFKKAGVYQ